jgi:hypothetical protein
MLEAALHCHPVRLHTSISPTVQATAEGLLSLLLIHTGFVAAAAVAVLLTAFRQRHDSKHHGLC